MRETGTERPRTAPNCSKSGSRGARGVVAAAAAIVAVASLSACQDETPLGPPPIGPAEVLVEPGEVTFFALGDTLTFSATPVNANGKALNVNVEWRSKNPSVVAIDPSSGVATSIGNGTTEVVAVADSKRRRATVAVSASIVNSAWVTELEQTDPAVANDSASVSVMRHVSEGGRR